MLSLEQGKKLVKLARDSIVSNFSNKKPAISNELKEEFSVKMGVFVTINKGSELRGCIGFPEPTYVLYDAVINGARSAAFSDPRFPPLGKEEVDVITVEVSVLSVPRLIEVRNPEDLPKMIQVGQDGLIIRGTFNSGLLLPQVAVEYKWDAKTFLEQTCVKAGLPEGTWMDFNSCRVYKFQGQVFSEQQPGGEVVQML
jgi:uncharacterized protein (TIGR00296 family)|tara:strand:- start:877 stop:1470 length:594 start_codon:yes stop_codon:yes gene_type:complete